MSELIKKETFPSDKDKMYRLYGVLENGETVYIGRFCDYVAIELHEEVGIKKENN